MLRYFGPALLALALFILLRTDQGVTAGGVIKDFDLKFCGSKPNCSRVQARVAEQSFFSDMYVLTDIRLMAPAQETLIAADGYFDPGTRRLILRGIKGQPYNEASFNLQSNELVTF